VSELTEPQERAIAAWRGNRLVVVRACPGSGKTRIFVEALKEELARSPAPRRGVAALSFTNVAQQEVAQRLGSKLAAPHLVNTLDTFLWRFVVVPFGHLVGVSSKGPVLVPAPLEKTLARPTIRYGGPRDTVCIFRCRLRTTATGTSMEVDSARGRSTVTGEQALRILGAKEACWVRTGRLTHSDAHYIAARVMQSEHGPKVASLIARRFRALLVDECQDTGGFMAEALIRIVQHGDVRALIVGDPDQAIYGFGGANRETMTRIAALGAPPDTDLDRTHRCAGRIARVVTGLSRRRATITPVDGAKEGRALLIVHEHEKPSIDDVLEELSRATNSELGKIAVLARTNSVLNQLRGTGRSSCPLASTVAKRIARAEEALHAGDARAAFTIAAHALGDLLLDDAPDVSTLKRLGIPRPRWRRAVYAILQEAAQEVAPETWGAWRERLKARCVVVANELGVAVDARRVGAAFRAGGSGQTSPRPIRTDENPTAVAASVDTRFDTIHGVKGQEFETVVVYYPKPHQRNAPCPSTQWWSADPESEEREVAFVATSRAKRVLALAVHAQTADALRREQPEFMALFDELRLPRQQAGPRVRQRRPVRSR
jgi:DNA helicase-2/ATP-dependent DNA helicase PcrA